jgi:hypothetical protein
VDERATESAREKLRYILCEVSDQYKLPISTQVRITAALWDAYAEVRAESPSEPAAALPMIACPGCSEASDSGRLVFHEAPACKVPKRDTQ